MKIRLGTTCALFAATLFFVGINAQDDVPCPDTDLPGFFDFAKGRKFVGIVDEYPASTDERVVGGVETAPNEFPHQVFIRVVFWSGSSAICGGTLIGDQWILTAAHCSYGAVNVTVILGAHDSTNWEITQQSYDINIRNIKNYESWYYGDLEGDISLIKLPTRITFNNYIKPARLPYIDDPSFEGESVILTGWGNFSGVVDSGLSPQLRKAYTTVLGSLNGLPPPCQRESGQNFNGENVICGDGSLKRGFCHGDDGGPMNYYSAMEKEWFVVGVATLGEITTECSASTKPSLYTRVTAYLSWIHNNTDIVPRPRPTTTTSTTTTTTTTTTTRTTTTIPTTTPSTTTTTPSTTTTTPSATTTTAHPISTVSTSRPGSFSCKGKPNGRYPVPGVECSPQFYMCSNGIAYLFDCAPQGAYFNVEACRCDYPYLVPGCPGYTMPPF